MYRSRATNLTPMWTILGVTVAVFLVSQFVPGMILRYGLVPSLVLERPWTLVTAAFLHGSFGHILGNMFTLYFFGRYVTELLGERAFMAVYFLGAVLGNVAYVLLAPQLSIAIGASGAVFAVGGVLVMLRPKIQVLVFPIPAPIPLWGAVLGGFVILSFLPNVAWQAHLGGLVLGLAVGQRYKTRGY